uniref:Uncharacterized protein n=1 Tax=Arundo donax TaxID=35708 RepID=A0A0A9EJE1_ARUDO
MRGLGKSFLATVLRCCPVSSASTNPTQHSDCQHFLTEVRYDELQNSSVMLLAETRNT